MRQHVWASHVGIGAAVIFLLSACVSSAAPSRVPASPTTTVAATAANAADTIARQWLTALQAKDLDAMATLFAPDGVFEDGATGETFSGGPQAETSGWGEALGMMITAKDASVLALGDGVAVLAYTFHGATPAHSSPIDVPMITVLHVKDTRITRETLYYNPKLAYGS
jgi:ketosteroid isomerase-like protein